jgi:fatty-acyl-CoA synthase
MLQTLPELLARGAARRPDAAAVTDREATLSWREFADRVNGLAAQLRRAGVGAGDAVALWAPNSADYLAMIFACARVGALAVHVNTRFRVAEVASLLVRTRARVLVTEWGFAPVDFAAILAGVDRESLGGLRLVIGRRLPPGVTEVAGIPAIRLEPLGTTSEGEAADGARPDAPCLTFTTSGTTSGPKLVLHDQRAIAGHAETVAAATGLDQPGAALLAVTPFCGTFGNVTAMAAVAGGAHVVCMDQFDPPEAVRLMRTHRVTHGFGGDDLLIRICEAAAGQSFAGIRMFGFASFTSGAALTAETALAMGLQPVSCYGSSEMQALFAFAPPASRLRMGGRPVWPQAEVSVRDPETGEVLRFGQPGELCFRGPSRFVGYLGDEAASARTTTPDGFFRSGDLGHLEGDGFVFHARIGDALRLGGFLVDPEEIEGFLVAQPGVEAAQVVAAGTEAKPVAFVIARPGAAIDEAALLAACRTNLARFKAPVRIVALEAFPTTDSPNGRKIQKARLRDAANALLDG